MTIRTIRNPRGMATLGASLTAIGLVLFAALPASAATPAAPIDLGSAAPFNVLGASTVTNTGPSILPGNLGVSPGTSITGFPPGTSGTIHQTDAVAAKAQSDLTSAYNVASGLTPQRSGLSDLVGLTLTPGVYTGGALSLSGDLTLAGTANSVWVFQADSTLVTGSGSHILLTGGANACNVFWKVGSSATLGSGSSFAGTIMAKASITANTTAIVDGRLLAETGAVTLDSNVFTAPSACVAAVPPVVTPPVVTPPIVTPPVTPPVVTPPVVAPPVVAPPVVTPPVVTPPVGVSVPVVRLPAGNKATPTAAVGSGRLAQTGSDSLPPFAAAIAFVAVGLFLTVLARRRGQRKSADRRS